MNVLLVGGTGLIGSELNRALIQKGHRVWILSRNPAPGRIPPGATGVLWDGRTAQGWGELLEEMDAVVNLAGENIGNWPWTPGRKEKFKTSRLHSGQAIVEAIGAARKKPGILLQASAVGYYGPTGDEIITEEAPAGKNYMSQLCVDWEESTSPVEDFGVRRVVVRTGIVLTPGGEILEKFMLPFKLFIGGPLGNGRQWVPWIHMADQIGALVFLMENSHASGTFNLMAPNPVQNADFGKALGRVMKRPYWIPAPAFALRLVLGEMSSLVLAGQRAVPTRLEKTGYVFQFPDVEPALRNILSS